MTRVTRVTVKTVDKALLIHIVKKQEKTVTDMKMKQTTHLRNCDFLRSCHRVRVPR